MTGKAEERIIMEMPGIVHSSHGLENHGLRDLEAVYWNLSTSALYEETIRRREARIAHLGPLVVRTGQHTGRSPNDKFIVEEPYSQPKIWWGKVNQPMSMDQFDALHMRMMSYLQGKDVFVQDCYAGADKHYRLPIRIITEYAWHSLFARNMFIHPEDEDLANHIPEFTVIDVPDFHADP